jgi:uncharacterized protein (UPF0548 family)
MLDGHMFSLAQPTHRQLRDFLLHHQDVPFTYHHVGATKVGPQGLPSGFSCGYQRIQLGSGRVCYQHAKESLQAWKMFPPEFVDLIWPCPIEAGRVVATLFRAPGVWTLNPCRIVYTIDDTGESEQYGFAYGTVGKHLASGEERFLVEYNPIDESVWYEVYCFSKVNQWLATAAYPYLRIQQHRFRVLSTRAMKQVQLELAVKPAALGS